MKSLKSLFSGSLKDDSGQAALVIITIVVISAGIAASTMSLQNSRRGLEVSKSTRTNFGLIKDAIEVDAIQDTAFLLPCPSDPAGTPASLGLEVGNNGTTCTINRGIVPWRTLGLSESSVVDSNGNYVTYIVDGTNVSVCDGENARAGTLNEASSGTDYNYALLSHGENGFGAYNKNSGNQTQVPTSLFELDNCPNPSGAGCDPGTDNEFRTGPFNEDDGTTEFDDIIRAVQASDTFTVECPVINEDSETTVVGDTSITSTDRSLDTLMMGTSTDATLQTRAIGRTTDGDIEQLIFTSTTTGNASAACDFFEVPIRLRDSVVRSYQEFGMLSDAGNVRGNGMVLGFVSYDPASYRLSTTNRNYICGGTDSSMGFANDPGIADRVLPNVPRLGIEIDTESHYVSTIAGTPPASTENRDVQGTLDHIAIVNGNVDHMGLDLVDSSTHGDGPACDQTTLDDTQGIQAGLIGCTSVDLEVGSNTGNPVQEDFHRLRVEMHYEGDPADNLCTVAPLSLVNDYVYVEYWLYTNAGTSSGLLDCPENPGFCYDLSQDYAETPTGRFCMPWSPDAGDEFVRFGLTTGAAAVGGSGRDEIRIQKIGVSSARTTAATFTLATANAKSGEITNIVAAQEYETTVTGLGANLGTLLSTDLNNTENTESGIVNLPTQNAKLVSSHGTITVNYRNTNDGTEEELWDGEGIGVSGVGNTDGNSISNFWEETDAGPPATGVYLDADKRESLTVEFEELYSRMTFNLGEFSDFTITDGTDGVVGDQTAYESVLVRAYNSTNGTPDTPVLEQTIDACTTNTANGNHMTVSLDLTTTPADKITFTPVAEPFPNSLTSGENAYGTEFWLRGIQACGADANCGLLIDTDCFVYDGVTNGFGSNYPYGYLGAGDTSTADITIESVQTAAGTIAGVAAGSDALRFEGNGETPWLHIDGPDGAGVGINLDIYANGIDVNLEERNNNNFAREGFSVDNTTILNTLNEVIDFRFHETWRNVALSIGHFGRAGGSGANTRVETVEVRGFRNGVQVDQTVPVAACAIYYLDPANASSSNGSKDFEVAFTQDIDQITVTPTTTNPLNTSNTSFVVRGIKACANGTSCSLGVINSAGVQEEDCNGGTIDASNPPAL